MHGDSLSTVDTLGWFTRYDWRCRYYGTTTGVPYSQGAAVSTALSSSSGAPDLKYARGAAQSAQGNHHHQTSETYAYRLLRQPLPQAHPEQRSEYGAHDQRRQTQEVAEARRDVAYRSHDTHAKGYREARRDRPLCREAKAKHHQGHHHTPAPDPHAPRGHPPKKSQNRENSELQDALHWAILVPTGLLEGHLTRRRPLCPNCLLPGQ